MSSYSGFFFPPTDPPSSANETCAIELLNVEAP